MIFETKLLFSSSNVERCVYMKNGSGLIFSMTKLCNVSEQLIWILHYIWHVFGLVFASQVVIWLCILIIKNSKFYQLWYCTRSLLSTMPLDSFFLRNYSFKLSMRIALSHVYSFDWYKVKSTCTHLHYNKCLLVNISLTRQGENGFQQIWNALAQNSERFYLSCLSFYKWKVIKNLLIFALR